MKDKKLRKIVKNEVESSAATTHWVRLFFLTIESNHREEGTEEGKKYCGTWMLCPLNMLAYGAQCDWRRVIDCSTLEEVEKIARKHWLKKHAHWS